VSGDAAVLFDPPLYSMSMPLSRIVATRLEARARPAGVDGQKQFT